MRIVLGFGILFMIGFRTAVANETHHIVTIDSKTPTEALLVKPGTDVDEKFLFEQRHSIDVLVRVGVWEAGKGKSVIHNFPFTEYVLMISSSVVVTDSDGTARKFAAGDTFVIPKGWSGQWDVRERMKEQIVRIGDAGLLQSQ